MRYKETKDNDINAETYELSLQCDRMLIMSFVFSLIIHTSNDEAQRIIVLILVTIQTTVLIISIFLVEKELKKILMKTGIEGINKH